MVLCSIPIPKQLREAFSVTGKAAR
ncbi:hypothetical protein LINPERHAP2_LOCUS24494 [Linum perenne]